MSKKETQGIINTFKDAYKKIAPIIVDLHMNSGRDVKTQKTTMKMLYTKLFNSDSL